MYQHGFTALMTIVPGPMSLNQAIAEAEDLLVEAAVRAMRLIRLGIDHLPPHAYG